MEYQGEGKDFCGETAQPDPRLMVLRGEDWLVKLYDRWFTESPCTSQ
jgi:hypothetical protein